MIDAEQFCDEFVIQFESSQVEVVRARQPADRRLQRAATSFAPINDPLQYAHVFAKAWPEEFSVRAFAKPVHGENLRWIREPFPNVEPVLEIISNVIPAERQHRHWIATHLTDSTGRRGGCFRSHRSTEVNTVSPIERLIDQRHRITAASAENNRADWHALALFHLRIQCWIIAHRRREPAVRMRSFIL